MEQHDSPVVDPGDELGEGLLRRGLVIGVPVHVGEAPKHRPIAQGLGLPEVLHAVLALGRAVKPAHLPAGGLPVQHLQRGQLLGEGLLLRDGGHVRVVVGVVAHDMALRRHPPDHLRGGLHHMPHHEESRRGAVLLQHIQYPLRIAVLVAAVEGEVDHLFLRVPHVVRVVGRQLPGPRIAHRSLSLLWKGQPPVVHRRRHRRAACGGDRVPAAAAAQGRQTQSQCRRPAPSALSHRPRSFR